MGLLLQPWRMQDVLHLHPIIICPRTAPRFTSQCLSICPSLTSGREMSMRILCSWSATYWHHCKCHKRMTMVQQGHLLLLILVPHICNQLEWGQFPPGSSWRPHPIGKQMYQAHGDVEHSSKNSGRNGNWQKSGDGTKSSKLISVRASVSS